MNAIHKWKLQLSAEYQTIDYKNCATNLFGPPK